MAARQLSTANSLLQHLSPPATSEPGERNLEQQAALDRFFRDTQRRAFRIAEIATGNRDDALELVQESMLGLVRRYSNRPSEEWKPLFYSILNSRINDWYRRRTVRNRVMSVVQWMRGDEEQLADPGDLAPDLSLEPSKKLDGHQSTEAIIQALKRLPVRQQQAFMLRAWEGMSTAETSAAMGCSEGSVKTHYSRATHQLREWLEGYKP